MPEINYIKHLRENENLSITKICERTGVDCRTAKKYADGEVPIHLLPQKRSGMMVMGLLSMIGWKRIYSSKENYAGRINESLNSFEMNINLKVHIELYPNTYTEENLIYVQRNKNALSDWSIHLEKQKLTWHHANSA